MRYLKLYEDVMYDDKEWEIKSLIIYSTYRGISNYYEMINRHFKKYALKLVDEGYLTTTESIEWGIEERRKGYTLTQKAATYMEEVKETIIDDFKMDNNGPAYNHTLTSNQIIILLCLCIDKKILSDFTTATEVRDTYLLSSREYINDNMTLTRTGRMLAMSYGYELKLKSAN